MTDLRAEAHSEDTAFVGHPRGLAYLITVEAFWAFSFFGLQSILTLYLTHQLLVPGHEERIWGIGLYRAFLDGGGARSSSLEVASRTFGYLTSLAYAFPLIGAIIADRWWGQRRTMTVGLVILAIAMTLGTFEVGFLVAAVLAVVGSGLLKSNLVVQIGRLYQGADPRRTSAFAYLLIAANVGGFSAPLIAGTLAEKVSFRSGLIALAIAMILALVAFLAGAKHMPSDAGVADHAAPVDAGERRSGILTALLLSLLLIPCIAFFGAYQQVFNVFPVWASDHVALNLGSFRMPVTWFSTLDGLLTIAGAAATIRFWDSQNRRGKGWSDVSKLMFGCALGVTAYLLIAGATLGAGSGKVPMLAAAGLFLLIDPAITWIDTVTTSLFSRMAPASLKSTMISFYSLSISAGYMITGQVGRLYTHLPTPGFWALHAGIVAVGLVFLALFGRPITRALAARAG